MEGQTLFKIRKVLLILLVVCFVMSVTSATVSAGGNFYVDQIIFSHTPQSGDWTMCFTIYHPDGSGDMRQLHPNKDFEGDPTVINVQDEYINQPGGDGSPFSLGGIEARQKVRFDLGLDDDWDESCGSPEDTFAGGPIIVKSKGQQRFVSGDWDFVVKFHLEENGYRKRLSRR